MANPDPKMRLRHVTHVVGYCQDNNEGWQSSRGG